VRHTDVLRTASDNVLTFDPRGKEWARPGTEKELCEALVCVLEALEVSCSEFVIYYANIWCRMRMPIHRSFTETFGGRTLFSVLITQQNGSSLTGKMQVPLLRRPYATLHLRHMQKLSCLMVTDLRLTYGVLAISSQAQQP
jgi:hypothetical protein